MPLWSNRGRLALEMGDLVLAKHCVDRARALSPHDPEVLNTVARPGIREFNHADAIVACERALAVAPEHDAARQNLAHACASLARQVAAQGEFDVAQGLYERALSRRPHDVPLPVATLGNGCRDQRDGSAQAATGPTPTAPSSSRRPVSDLEAE